MDRQVKAIAMERPTIQPSQWKYPLGQADMTDRELLLVVALLVAFVFSLALAASSV